MIKQCSITGPLRFHEFYSHLKDTENYIFHETAGMFMKFMLSKISDLKNEYSKLKLHYVPNPNPEYVRNSPHVKKHHNVSRNKHNVSSENLLNI